MSTNNEENKNVMLESHRKDDPDKKPGVHNNSSGGMNPNTNKKWQFSILYFVIMLLLILFINSMLFTSNLEPVEVEYSTFTDMISNGQIQQVAFTEHKNIVYSRAIEEAKALSLE